jgi:hypothetical protein
VFNPAGGDFAAAADKIQIRNGFILNPIPLSTKIKKDSCHAGFYFHGHS